MPTLKVWNGSEWEYLTGGAPILQQDAEPGSPVEGDLWIDTDEPSGSSVWGPWTPTLTNLTLGNGTVTASYVQDGDTVHWRFKFVLGSTSAVAATPGISLPVAAHADYVAQFPIGMVRYFDTSAGLGFSGYMRIEPPNEARFLRHGGASSQDIGISSTTPMTWATGDGFYAFGSYETA